MPTEPLRLTPASSPLAVSPPVWRQAEEDGLPVSVRAKLPATIVRPQGLYLVTGGAGGFGARIVARLVKQGARHIVVTVSKDPRCAG